MCDLTANCSPILLFFYLTVFWSFCLEGYYERQYWKLYWNPERLYHLAFFGKLAGWSCKKEIKFVRHDSPFVNPCWLWPMATLSFRYFSISSRIIFFTVLAGTEMRRRKLNEVMRKLTVQIAVYVVKGKHQTKEDHHQRFQDSCITATK